MGQSGWVSQAGSVWLGQLGWVSSVGLVWLGLSGWVNLARSVCLGQSGWVIPVGSAKDHLLTKATRGYRKHKISSMIQVKS